MNSDDMVGLHVVGFFIGAIPLVFAIMEANGLKKVRPIIKIWAAIWMLPPLLRVYMGLLLG